MKYRKLRIAWSVVWGTIAVLLFVLWVRSYYHVDLMDRVRGPIWTRIDSTSGSVGFHRRDMAANRGFVIRCPTWILSVAAILLATISWPTRFSLRTLLIATTLVAVLLGLTAWMMR
jgi:hypothetical protein